MPTRYRLALTLLAAAALCAAAASAAQPNADVRTGQHPQTLQTDATKAGEIRYLLYVPEAYPESKQRWPLVLFLHGAGERGDDLEKVKVHGPPKLVGKGKALPFLCVSPQCPKGGWWDRPDQVAGLVALLDHLQKTLRVDPDRVYLTGLSMGGFGTWALAMKEPKRFAAIAPICGKGDPSKAERIAHLPTWVFHGGKDRVVPTRHSEEMVEALKAAGGDPKLTVYPDAGHDSWTRTYENPEFWKWLLAQRRKK
ncbi:MAG: prolyl oligopeptidase family serine peptidase [Planctomycetota bacterium]|nr:prolyl oligopeptidase family serine peptidase [Planctomycetota bacterium]